MYLLFRIDFLSTLTALSRVKEIHASLEDMVWYVQGEIENTPQGGIGLHLTGHALHGHFVR